MPKHLSPEEFEELSKRYAITEDPDDLGCVPTLTPQKADMNALQKAKEKLRKKSESEKVAEQLLEINATSTIHVSDSDARVAHFDDFDI